MLVGANLDEINKNGDIGKQGYIKELHLEAPIDVIALDLNIKGSTFVLSETGAETTYITYLGTEVALTSLLSADNPLALNVFFIDEKTALLQLVTGEMGVEFFEEEFIIDHTGQTYEKTDAEPYFTLTMGDLRNTIIALIIEDARRAARPLTEETAYQELINCMVTIQGVLTPTMVKDEHNRVVKDVLPTLIPDLTYTYMRVDPEEESANTVEEEYPVGEDEEEEENDGEEIIDFDSIIDDDDIEED